MTSLSFSVTRVTLDFKLSLGLIALCENTSISSTITYMRTVICTVCSGNYLPNAILGLTTLRAQNPDSELALLIVEKPEVVKTLKVPDGVNVYSPSDIALPEWNQMAFWYNVIEYNTSLKPAFFTFLFDQGFESLIFVDPDIKAYHPFAELFEKLKSTDVLLTPHFLNPIYDDGKAPLVEHIMAAGVYNLGFIGLRSSKRVLEVLQWWKEMLYEKCIHQFGFGYFVDQFWAGAFPAYFDRIEIIRSQSYNAAWWNCFERRFHQENGKWHTEDGPLVFFHFSQIASDAPEEITHNQTRSKTTRDSDLYRLIVDYLNELNAMRKEYPYENMPYSFNTYVDGQAIDPGERKLIRDMTEEERKPFQDFFGHASEIKSLLAQKSRFAKTKKLMRFLFR